MDDSDPARDAPDSTEAIAQSRTGGSTPATDEGSAQPGEGELYVISGRVELAHATRPYEKTGDDPLYRRLPVFALDASLGAGDGGITMLKLPYEPLEPGPVGAIFAVDATIDGAPSVAPADLDQPHVLLVGGYRPTITDPKFHQQMVYAVATHTYGQFQMALGRQPAWGFDRRGADGNNRLILRPFGAEEANAWYDRDAGEIRFGYFQPIYSTPSVPALEGSHVFLSLSHDIIVHEVTHALLDGLRPEFHIASHPDVPAFHEAFADLIAVFQRFSHENVVTAALGRSRGDLAKAEALCSIGAEFGRATRREQTPLRTLYEELGRLGDTKENDDGIGPPTLPDEPHERGRVLARAVFRAFATLYERKAKRFVRLATGGTGALPAGEISDELRRFLVEEIRQIAGQFASICIRAIDYCPPVDLRFGDYLRALVTADLDLVPDDDWGYRSALISSFGVEGIYGEGTAFMTEEALRWLPPQVGVPPVNELSFGETRFDGDPARPATAAELRRQAGVIGRLVANPRLSREFGLVSPRSETFATGGYGRPEITSVRSARRVGPDLQVTFDTVAEVVQQRLVSVDGMTFPVLGGSTIVVGPRGEIRFVIRKRVDHEVRAREQADYINHAGFRFWDSDGAALAPRPDGLRLMCAPS